jgi:hypothetical protein
MAPMTLDEARSCLDRGEPDVLYRPAHGGPEHGVITSVNEAWVFVRFGTQATPAATGPADLEALTPAQARRWQFRHPLRAGGGNG